MKLTSRLVLVLTFFISASTFAAGAFSVIAYHDQQVNNYRNSLDSIYKEMSQSKEDPVSLALLIANQNSEPMTLAFITDNNAITYLVDDAGIQIKKVNKDLIDKGDRKSISIGSDLVRFFKTGKGEALAFIYSTKSIDNQISQIWQKIFLFNLFLILMSVGVALIVFRRDARINSAARAMQEFIGDASHELKTPLTVIRGYSELLSNSSENSQTYAKKINDESLRMSNIIDSLLKIAALNEGHKGESTSIDLAEYLKTHIDDVLVLQPKRQITFSSAPLIIEAPYELIDTLLSNILTNARIHSPESAPINVSIDGKQVVIEDGGPGLKEIPDKPFKRFDASRSRETGGSGLGMSLIQKSAKELGAKLHFSKSSLGGLKVEIIF